MLGTKQVSLNENRRCALSATPIAHPPRSNPFLRSSSDAPPFPCITPATVAWVMVDSFSRCGQARYDRIEARISSVERGSREQDSSRRYEDADAVQALAVNRAVVPAERGPH